MAERETTVVIARNGGSSGRDGTFDLTVNRKGLGHLDYSLPDKGTLTIDYVQVDPSLRGQGMGQKLVAAAVAWARQESRKVVPYCSYARAVMARTDDYKDVMA
ncbi:MAG TPA: GNAT family N-acetyltransferase [Vicinamibacterales bacterium]|nr:GNAT family N-acetyltransferase [Vicinamibacterales bacterium]